MMASRRASTGPARGRVLPEGRHRDPQRRLQSPD
jgi:hypothetical protein